MNYTDTNPKVSLQLASPNSSQLNLNQIESGYLSGGTSVKNNHLTRDKGTPKYASSTALDMGSNQFSGAGGNNSKQQSSNMMKHRMAVQNSIKNSNRGNNTPMSGGRRKRISAYEPASDDESVLEFQNMESQLLKDGGQVRKSNMHIAAQDQAQPNNIDNNASKFKKSANNSKTVTHKNSTNNVNKSKQQQQQQSQQLSRKSTFNNINQKQSQTKPIAKEQQQPQQQSIATTNQQQNNKAKSTKGGCCGIFCCGYCCSKGAGVSDKDKTQEMDLRPEQRQLPDIQEMKSPANQSMKDANYYYNNNDQDLSQIDDQEELEYNQSINQSDDQKQHNDYPQLLTDSQQLSQVIEQEIDHDMDMDDLGDEEKIELDLRSELKIPNSGEQSAGGIQGISLKSSTDPMEMKRLNHHNDDDDPLITDPNEADNEDYRPVNVQVTGSNNGNNDVDDSYEMDRKHLMEKNINKNSQPRLIQDDDDEVNGNADSDHLRQQYSTVPDPERRYSNDQFMRIEGPSPDHQLLIPLSNIQGNSNSQTPSINGNDGTDEIDLSSDRNRKSNGSNGRSSGGHQRIAGDDMGDAMMDDDEDAGADDNNHNGGDSSLRELDDQSDKTIDNDQEQYKLAQAKRMYVIHEVDEDAFSEKSSRRGGAASDRSKLINTTNPYGDNNRQLLNDQESLQALKEEQPGDDDEDVYGLNNLKHQQTLSMVDNDELSSMQINASQDIEPHNTSQNNMNNNQRSSKNILNNNSPIEQYSYSDRTMEKQNPNQNISPLAINNNQIKIIDDSQQKQVNQLESNKTPTPHNGQKNKQQLLSTGKDQNDGEVQSFDASQFQQQKQQEPLLNFQQYMEDQEAKQQRQSNNNLTSQQNLNQQQKNISPISNDKEQQQQQKQNTNTTTTTAFFRPHNNQNLKGSVNNNRISRPSNESIKQIEEEIVLIDNFTSSNNNNNNKQPFEYKQQQNNVQQSQQQPQVIIQKLQIDKSKLSQTYYSNFDQFVIANNLNLDDSTKKAAIQQHFKESDTPFDVNSPSKEKLSSESLQTTKQQALKHLENHNQLQSKQKHDLALKAKEKAMRKEKERLAKQQCAIKIQKVWKGHVQREEYIGIRDNLRKVKNVRRIFEQAWESNKNGLINGLCFALKEGKANKDRQEQEIMENFLNVCALQIQSNWRGHVYRKNTLPSLKKQRKIEERFRAFVKGWKMRKVIQTREVFTMSQHIKDLTKVQEYFIYVEKSDNLLLLGQLKKDRKKAITGFIELIEHLYTSGAWIKGYIGNKIVENEDQLDSTMDGLESNMKSPIKDYNLSDLNSQLKELITTERFLYDDDLERNPYIFETDEFVRQKFLERRQREYMGVDIEYVDQKTYNKQSQNSKKNLKNVDDDSSRYDDSESVQFKNKQKVKGNSKFKESFESDFRGSINPKDNQVIQKNKKTFEQMLEDAMSNEKGSSKSGGKNIKNSGSKEFLKRKEKYDPQKSLRNKKGEISNKNIEKKRVFKSKNRMGSEESDQDQGYEDQDIYSDDNQTESRGTFKHFPRKSFIQLENNPLPTNKTVLPPSLLQKLYIAQLKMQKYLRTDTGRQIGSNPTKFQTLNKNQQVYPQMPLGDDNELQLSLNLKELENIFQVYHSGQDANLFFKSKDIRRDKDSKITILKEKALFYKYYDDQIYESQLDDMKKDYQKQMKLKKKWMYGAQKLY